MPSVLQNETVRVAVGTGLGLGALVAFTEVGLWETVPIALFAGVGIGTRYVAERYDLSAGTNGTVYGSLLAIGGGLLVLRSSATIAGTGLAVAGGWFVLDGLVRMRYGPAHPRHPYVDGSETSDAVVHRMVILSRVYRTLRAASAPQSPAAVAERCAITPERAEDALAYLASRDRVESVGDRYRAVPSRWGRVTPFVRGAIWLPKRVLQPIRRLLVGGS